MGISIAKKIITNPNLGHNFYKKREMNIKLILTTISVLIILIISCFMTIYLKSDWYLWLNVIGILSAMIISEEGKNSN